MKGMTGQQFSQEGADRRSDRIEMENFYFSAIYSVLHDTAPQTDQAVALKLLKVKIIRINSKHNLGMFIDNGEQDRINCEEPSLHHLLKIRKWQTQPTFPQVYDMDGSLRVFTDYMRRKYDHIHPNEDRMRHGMTCGLKKIHPAPEESITINELFQAVKQGKPNKEPGQDGICLEVVKKTWEVKKYNLLELVNNMYRDRIISDQQNHGIVACLPKIPDRTRIKVYRPLTLMSTDYNLFTIIISNRLRP